MAEIASLVVADPAALWRDLGFAVGDGEAWIGDIRVALGAPGRGIVAWTVDGLAPGAPLTELPVAGADDVPAAEPPGSRPPHPNGVIDLDHVVVTTPDLARSVAAFEAAGVRCRRTRDAGTPQRPLQQAFFRLGPTIVEVVGSPTDAGPGPAQLSGLAFTVADLDVTAAALGERLRPAIDAVQAGRRIATLTREAGSTVPMAFMSPAPR